MTRQFKIIMNYQSMPCYPRSKQARVIFYSILTAEAAIRKEFSLCKWSNGTTASVVSVKPNGQHDQMLLTLIKSDGLVVGARGARDA